MKVVLLCAGYGVRLHPLTRDRPKPLLPVGGRPILEHLLERIGGVPSIEQVFVVTNERFYAHFKSWAEEKHFPWKVEVVNDGTRTNETRLGAIGDLAFVVRKYAIHDDVGIVAGDNLFRSDLRNFFIFAERRRPHATVGVVDVARRDRARQYGVVRLDPEGRIVEFLEKPKEPPSTLASTGIYWLAKETLDFLDRYMREGHNADRLGDFISWLIKIDRVFAFPLEGTWFDIGDLRSYKEADRLFQHVKSDHSE